MLNKSFNNESRRDSPMKTLLLSIIVISYNTREMTLECIRSIFIQTKNTNFEVIVFDNASNDDSATAIENEFGNKVKLIASMENFGFAAGNNMAASEAKGDYILLLNPDTVVLDNAIDHLMEFSQEYPHSGIWGGKTLFGDKSLNPASCWSEQSLWSLFSQVIGFTSLFRRFTLFNPEGMGGWDRQGIRYVDIVSGCFFLIHHKLWKKLDGFSNLFFMYGEEADLCLRAREYGAKPIVTSDATIIHYGGASEKVRTDMMVRLLKAKYLLIQLHFSNKTNWLATYLLYLWPVSRYVAHSILTIFGRKSSGEARKVWREIYNRKNEWAIKKQELLNEKR